jgi:hypothetical protein
MPLARNQTTMARRMLRIPAARIVPGSPCADQDEALASTPMAAPRLLVKYSIETTGRSVSGRGG